MGIMDLFDALGPAVAGVLAHRRESVTRHFVLAVDAAEQMAAALASDVAGRRAALVADTRTAAVGVEACVAALRARGFQTALHILPDAEGHEPVCDDKTCSLLVG